MSTENTKTFKGRISNKHGTEADWYAAGTAANPFIPLDGELIIYDPDAVYTEKRTKIGDGSTPVHLLPWASGCDESVGLDFSGNGDTCTIDHTGNCHDTVLNIPRAINGRVVTSIHGGAFSNCTELIGITIPNSVTSIGDSAFEYCRGITSMTIPDSITSISVGCFGYCDNLISVILGNHLSEIGANAFYKCSSLTDVYYTGSEEEWNNISISSGNECLINATIHYNYFDDFQTLNNKLGDTTDLETESKEAVGAINEIHKNITEYTYSEGLQFKLNSAGTGYIFEDVGTCTDKEIIIPKQYLGLPVTEVAFYACQNNTSITGVIIPNTVTYIGSVAFNNCTSLEYVFIPSSTGMSYGLCSNCSKVTLYCEPESKPSSWANFPSDVPAVWGCSSSIFNIQETIHKNQWALSALKQQFDEGGADGEDGREIELQKGTTYIQWRYVGDTTWKDLIAIADLKGADGEDGQDGTNGTNGMDGREVELQKSATHIQWRYTNGTWENLVALSDLKGANGTNGQNGTSVTITSISESTAAGGTSTVTFSDGKTLNIKNGTNGKDGADGSDATVTKAAVEAVLTGKITSHSHDFTDEHFRLKSLTESTTNYAYLVGSTDAPTNSDGVITTGSTVDATYIIPDKKQLHAKGYVLGGYNENDATMEYDSTYKAIKFVFN